MNKPKRNIFLQQEKDFLLHKIIVDLSSDSIKREYQPIKRIKTPNTGYFYGKRTRSNENPQKAKIPILEAKFLVIQQLFVGPLKENKLKNDKNDSLQVKKVEIQPDKEKFANSKERILKNKASETRLKFFKTEEDEKKEPEKLKIFEKLPILHFTPPLKTFKPYQSPLFRNYRERSPGATSKAPFFKTEKREMLNKPINNNPPPRTQNAVIDKYGSWSIKSSVSLKLEEEI